MPPQRSFVDYLTAQREIKEQFLRERQALVAVPPEYDPIVAACYDELAIICRLLGDMDAYRRLLGFGTNYGTWHEKFHFSEGSEEGRDLLPALAGYAGSSDERIGSGRRLIDAGIMLTLARKDPEKPRLLFESAVVHCIISPGYVASRHDRYALTRIAYAHLWKGYALLCLRRFDDAEKLLLQVAPIYRALKLQSTHDPRVSAVIEMALAKALVPLCAFERAPVKKNLIDAQKGLEEFIGALHDNVYRLRGYTYYFHLKEQFAEVYSADPAQFPDSIPGFASVPPKPVLVYVEKQNNWAGSVYIRDPAIVRRREYLCSNPDFRTFTTYCRALEAFPALASLVDVYALGQCTDPRPVAAECERLAALQEIDPRILRIAGRIGAYAREAARQNSSILLDYDPDRTPEPRMHYFPKPPGLPPGEYSRPPLVPRRAHAIAFEKTRRGSIAIGLHDADDPGIDLREYLRGSPEYRAVTETSRPEGSGDEQGPPRYRISPESTRRAAFERDVRRLLLLLDTIPLRSERLQRAKEYIDAAAFAKAYDALREEELASEQERLLAARTDRSMNPDLINALLRVNAHEYFIKALLADLVSVDRVDGAKDRFFRQSLKSYPLPDVLFEYGIRCQRICTGNEPEAVYQKILENRKNYPPRLTAAAMHNLAVMYLNSGDLVKAEEGFQEVLEYCRSQTAHEPGTYLPYLGAALSNMASLYIEFGDYEKAEKLSREALRHYRTCAAADSYTYLPAVARELFKIAELRDTLHDSIVAGEELETAVEISLTLAMHDPGRYLPMYADALRMKRALSVQSLANANRFGSLKHVAEKKEKDIREIDAILQSL